jgi:hypothetical protein
MLIVNFKEALLEAEISTELFCSTISLPVNKFTASFFKTA